jgi:glycosyltransferase involved in cell wall biosynthesis
VGEAGLPGTRQYVAALMPWLLSWSAAHVVHSEYDRRAIASAYPLGMAPVRVIRHGPYDHLTEPSAGSQAGGGPVSDDGPLRLLYLGLVRPFKGVEDLVEAFSGLDREQAERFRLAIVGETREGWTAPAEAIAGSPYADLIERIDGYMSDAELSAWYALADAVVLPYHRSSGFGPLQIAMSAGLPVVVTAVGGLAEATRDYPGALLVPPRDPVALRGALLALPGLRGQRYAAPDAWACTADAYASLIDEIRGGRPLMAKSPAVASPW